jgi:hypothetical protein
VAYVFAAFRCKRKGGRSDGGRPCGRLPVCSERTVARVWLVDPPRRRRRNERNHDCDEVDTALVSYRMHPCVEESRPGRVRFAGVAMRLTLFSNLDPPGRIEREPQGTRRRRSCVPARPPSVGPMFEYSRRLRMCQPAPCPHATRAQTASSDGFPTVVREPESRRSNSGTCYATQLRRRIHEGTLAAAVKWPPWVESLPLTTY